MRWRCPWSLALLLLGLSGSVALSAGPGKIAPPQDPLALLSNGSPDALAGNLRGYLVQALPQPLFEDHKHWNQKKWVTRGIKWRGKGLRIHPERQRQLKNHGQWWKVRVEADRPADTLLVDIREVQTPEPGRILFTAFLSLDTRIYYDRQHWRHNVRLYAGSIRARMRVSARLRCETIARLDTTTKWNPEVILGLRVVQANVGYDNLVVEHLPGIGGDLAKFLGAAVHASIIQWRPSLERKLLEKLNAAIVKAGHTREVRITLLKLLGHK
jgi:hypothetical protein